jgi:sugar transferase (PEP-CTERM system associated)
MIRVFSKYISTKSLVLALLEGSLITLALVCAVRIRFWDNTASFEAYLSWPDFASQAIVFVATLQICFYYCDLYNLRTRQRRNETMMAVAQSLGAGCLLLGILYFVFPGLVLGRGVFFITMVLVPVFVGFSRAALDPLWQAAAPPMNVLILGTDALACLVASELAKRRDLNVRLSGFVDVHQNTNGQREMLMDKPVFGSREGLASVVEQHAIQRIIVALEDRRNLLPVRDLVRLRVQGVRIEEAHSTISALTGREWLSTVKPSWFVFSNGFQRSQLTLILKRVIDLASGLCGLVISSPIMLLIAIAIRIDSKGPIIFRQKRVGLGGRCFEVLKFRSMRTDAEATGAKWATKNDPRVTRCGGFLRKYRLDELPQFVNVIRGEMSLVGPRPERPEFVEELRKQISYYDERHSVRPGLTGWAQTQYQYGSSVEDAERKLEYDLFYLKNMSIFFDCAIILDTFGIVLSGSGAR